MAEKIDPTWLAYALDEPATGTALDAAVARVRGHYDELVDYPTRAEHALGPRLGVLVIGDAEPRCRWPHFTAETEVALATAYVPTGWERLVGDEGAAPPPITLAGALLTGPERLAAALAAPFVIAALDRAEERLVIANDAIGAGRLYEARLPGARVWSNRAAAPLLFAGAEPRADARGWRMLAAATWLIGDATLLEGVAKVGAGTVIEADRDGVRERATGAVGGLVRPSRDGLQKLLIAACDDAVGEVRAAGRAWPATADIDLSGGRDSRTVAAAAVAAGLDARFNTSDVTPGEADVARELVGRLPGEVEHRIRKSDDEAAKQHERPLLQRALNSQLLHDAMRNPQKVRSRQHLPSSRPESATLSGHGGEIAHAFFYTTQRELHRIRWTGRRGVRTRLRRLFAKGHGAARDACYEEAAAEVDRVLEAGRSLGVKGPALLDWFYLVDRFANRSGVGAHAERVSIFGTPAFIRASFALTPAERLEAVLHREMVSRLVPEWTGVPYFKAKRGRVRATRRLRMWEAPDDAAAIEAIIGADGVWTEVYDPDRVRSAWNELTRGGGYGNWESIFEGIAYREAFEEFLAILRERSRARPPLLSSIRR